MNDGQLELQAQENAWAQTLARIAEERAQARAQEVTGRGVRRRVAPTSLKMRDGEDGDTPVKRKKGKTKATVGSDEEDILEEKQVEQQLDETDGELTVGHV